MGDLSWIDPFVQLASVGGMALMAWYFVIKERPATLETFSKIIDKQQELFVSQNEKKDELIRGLQNTFISQGALRDAQNKEAMDQLLKEMIAALRGITK